MKSRRRQDEGQAQNLVMDSHPTAPEDASAQRHIDLRQLSASRSFHVALLCVFLPLLLGGLKDRIAVFHLEKVSVKSALFGIRDWMFPYDVFSDMDESTKCVAAW